MNGLVTSVLVTDRVTHPLNYSLEHTSNSTVSRKVGVYDSGHAAAHQQSGGLND
jgi:hypothetical protein